MFVRYFLFLILFAVCGCAALPRTTATGVPPTGNQLVVRSQNEELVWETTVDVLHDFLFRIAREDKVTRVIETEYKTGSGLLEPWHRESVGFTNRLESTLQSIRRKVTINVLPSETGGYVVSVVAVKEEEDVEGLVANSPGRATFLESQPLKRDLNQVVGQTRPSGWVPRGRDLVLEQAIIEELQTAFSR